MVASLQACVNPAVGSRLAARLLEAVSEQYREYLCKVVRNPRGFKGMSKLLCAVLQVWLPPPPPPSPPSSPSTPGSRPTQVLPPLFSSHSH